MASISKLGKPIPTGPKALTRPPGALAPTPGPSATRNVFSHSSEPKATTWEPERVRTSLMPGKSTILIPPVMGARGGPRNAAPSTRMSDAQPPSSLMHSFERITPSLWFFVECGPVTVGQNTVGGVAEGLLTEFSNQGVFAVRCTRRKRGVVEPYLGCLYFKNVSLRDQVLQLLTREKDKRGFDTVRGSIASGVPLPYTARVDLLYVDEVYAYAGDEQERRALLACGPAPMLVPEDFKLELLDCVRHPPRAPMNAGEFPPRTFDARKRTMQIIEFPTLWLMERIDRIHDVPIDLRRLQMLVRIHGRNEFKKAFTTPIWPTTGKINTLIRQIAKWAEADGLRQVEVRMESRETIGFTVHRNWRLTLEMALPEPRFLKDPREEQSLAPPRAIPS
jgi:hypothetical protein